MQSLRSIRTLIAAAAAVAVLSFVALASAQSPAPQRFRAFAALVNHVPGDQAVSVDNTIDRWSTDDERQTLLNLARGSDVELSADGKHLQIDDYATQPVPLQKVRRIE